MPSAAKILAFCIFLFLDLLDAVLCVVYRFIDGIVEGSHGGSSSDCYCSSGSGNRDGRVNEVSESLYARKNMCRKILGRKCEVGFEGEMRKAVEKMERRRWSDCGCESCLSWMKNCADLRLHVSAFEPSQVQDSVENVIFLHGFLASSSFWTETVVPKFSDRVKGKYRLFAVDLLGFGRSPKPRDCLYTLGDHVDMVEKSVLKSYGLRKFHIVAHSMGCVVALALAAKYADSVKTVTLVAPPYFPSEDANAGLTALEKLAEKKIWPLLSFGSAVMSWYEHVGRSVCFFICRYHLAWEAVLKLVTRKRDLHFMIVDLTRHTHHSGWHSMHNILCGGVKFMDDYLTALNMTGVKLNVIQGNRDQVVPLECLHNLKMKAPNAHINFLKDADHNTVILGREKEFARELESFWAST